MIPPVRFNTYSTNAHWAHSSLLALFTLLALVAMTPQIAACGNTPQVEKQPNAANTASKTGAQTHIANAGADGGITLIWGTIADNPQEEQDKLDEWGDFLNYMRKHLRSHGVADVKLVFCHSPQEMADWMRDRKVDLFDESPFGAYLVHRLGEYDEPLLNRWKNGNEKFGSVIFVKKDSGITSLEQLRGKRIVFRGDTSTANYFRPKVHLVKKGYKLVEKKDFSDPVAPDEIGYNFVWSSRDKQVETVMDGRAAAGGISDEFIDQLLGNDVGPPGSARHPRDEANQFRRDDLLVLSRIPGVLRRLVTVRKGLDSDVKSAVRELLINMHTSAEGRAVLATFGPSTRFSVADTDVVAYQGILDQGELVEQEVRKFAGKR